MLNLTSQNIWKSDPLQTYSIPTIINKKKQQERYDGVILRDITLTSIFLILYL